MLVAPKPFKYKCLKCGYSKIIKSKSDVINPAEWNNICPKYQTQMNRKKLNAIEKIFWR